MAFRPQYSRERERGYGAMPAFFFAVGKGGAWAQRGLRSVSLLETLSTKGGGVLLRGFGRNGCAQKGKSKAIPNRIFTLNMIVVHAR